MSDQAFDISQADEMLALVEKEIEEARGPDISTGIPACQQELEVCKRGMATLDHLFGRILDDVDNHQQTWDSTEAEAARAARADAPKAATATEIKGLITEWVNKRPSAHEARESYRQALRRKEKVERWMRSLEKRMSAAQSAMNGHDSLGKYGGGA